MKRDDPVDVAIVGGGWSGLVMAKELATRTSLKVLVLERGPARKSTDYSAGMDEVDYALRNRMMQNPADNTITHRHSLKDRAAPIRQYGAFKPGTGTGGSGEHWGGISDRFLPEFFTLKTHLREKHGNKLPEDLAVEDFGMTFDEFENDYWRAEQLMGVSGKAGNLRGKLMEGGNIFEGPRSHEYPTPPLKPTYAMTFYHKAVLELGYHPYPLPAANLSELYTNPDGVTRPACTYCGYCANFGCMVGARAQPTNVCMPVLQRRKNFTIRNNANVRRVVHRDGRAEGVTYMDEKGEEHLQPANIVVLAAWTTQNTRLLALSKIGTPYDPETGQGTLGRNLTHQVVGGSGTYILSDKPLNAFMVSGAVGYSFADYDGDRKLDPSWGILRGGTFNRGAPPGALPIASFGRMTPGPGKRDWGSEWKKANIQTWDHVMSGSGFRGDHLAYRQNYMDLDPTYTDKYGDPLLRMTIEWTEHEYKQFEFGARISTEVTETMGRIMGLKVMTGGVGRGGRRGRYNATQYNTTHIQGGVIMGASRERSVLNPWLQHWDVPNLWVVGSCAFPQMSSANPTLSIVAVTIRAADGIVDRYMKHPGALA